jgi:DNA-binding MarR family transcriptional regulator
MVPAATATITSEQCAREVMETVPLVMRRIRAEMRSRRAPSLSVPQFRALAFLSREPGAALASVAEHLGISRSTASALVDRLVRRELVSRVENPLERRSVVLTLTEAGARQLQQARAATWADLATALDSLSADDLLQVRAGLALLNRAFRDGVATRRR